MRFRSGRRRMRHIPLPGKGRPDLALGQYQAEGMIGRIEEDPEVLPGLELGLAGAQGDVVGKKNLVRGHALGEHTEQTPSQQYKQEPMIGEWF